MMKKCLFVFAILLGAMATAHGNDAEIRERATVRGHVVNMETQEKLPFLTISLKGTMIGTSTDESGAYILRNVPSGKFVIEASGIGYLTASKEITLKKGEVLVVNFEVEEDLEEIDEVVVSANRSETTRRLAPTLVSVMAVNHETGVIQPIADIAARVHRAGARLHVDAAQALGKLAIDVRAWDMDMLSLSGHKIGAPVGIGALYVRRLPKMRLQAQQHGGGQERGRRSGTSPVALARALALASDIAEQARAARWQYVAALRATLLANLPAAMHTNVPEAAPQVPHIVSLFTGRPAADVLRAADAAGLALAAGSACSASDEGSHVLKAMGLGEAAAQSLRISLSHLSTEAELARLSAFLHSL